MSGKAESENPIVDPHWPHLQETCTFKISRHSFVSIRFFMSSFKNSTLPSKFNNLFFMNSLIHNYNARNTHSFHLAQCKTNTRLFSIYFQGPKFFTSLNSVMTGLSSYASFKKAYGIFSQYVR